MNFPGKFGLNQTSESYTREEPTFGFSQILLIVIDLSISDRIYLYLSQILLFYVTHIFLSLKEYNCNLV